MQASFSRLTGALPKLAQTSLGSPMEFQDFPVGNLHGLMVKASTLFVWEDYNWLRDPSIKPINIDVLDGLTDPRALQRVSAQHVFLRDVRGFSKRRTNIKSASSTPLVGLAASIYLRCVFLSCVPRAWCVTNLASTTSIFVKLAVPHPSAIWPYHNVFV